MRLSVRVLLPLLAAFVVALSAACSNDAKTAAVASPAASATGGAAVSPLVSTQQPPTAAPSNGQTMTVQELVKLVRPSVVRVSVTGRTGAFGQANSGTGTGFVIDASGYILTNNHVVTLGGGSNAGAVKVDFADGRSMDAKVVGRDELSDLAVLKVDASGLTPLRFADPSSIEVGEDVVAVGFALDLEGNPTVTRGVVSAKDREIQETLDNGQAVSISGAIQTDAAVNPGNSGGPLLDLQGNVVGVNTAGLFGGARQPVQGISFAVSSQVAQPIATSLMKTGSVQRGYLGVQIQSVDREAAQQRNLPVSAGAYLAAVEPGSPADKAGLHAGDIIVKIGTTDIKNTGDITFALTQHAPGDKVPVEYYRGSDKQSTDLTLGERPANLR